MRQTTLESCCLLRLVLIRKLPPSSLRSLQTSKEIQDGGMTMTTTVNTLLILQVRKGRSFYHNPRLWGRPCSYIDKLRPTKDRRRFRQTTVQNINSIPSSTNDIFSTKKLLLNPRHVCEEEVFPTMYDIVFSNCLSNML